MALVLLSGPGSYWQVRWEHRGLFGPKLSPWYVTGVRRWERLDVWLRIPEGADLIHLKDLSGLEEKTVELIIPYGDQKEVAPHRLKDCRRLTPLDNWRAARSRRNGSGGG